MVSTAEVDDGSISDANRPALLRGTPVSYGVEPEGTMSEAVTLSGGYADADTDTSSRADAYGYSYRDANTQAGRKEDAHTDAGFVAVNRACT